MTNSKIPPQKDSASDIQVSVGIVCALNLEIAPFLEHCEKLRTQSGNGLKFRGCRLDGIPICVVEGGAGSKRASQATHALIDAFQPQWVLSVGFSGSLCEQVRFGDVVVGNSLTDESGTAALQVDLQMESSPAHGLVVGKLCTVDHIVREVEEKRELGGRTGAVAVDMESLTVAQICQQRRTRFMAVRVISDDLTSDLPPEVLAILGPKGTVRAGALVASLLKRPSSARDLWDLRNRSATAAEHLGRFLPGVVRQLAKS